jgi:arylsulfatase A
MFGALPPVSRIGLNPSEKTVAELLKPCGYATMCIGKWHLGDQPDYLPTKRGFDHYLGLPYSNDMGGEKKKKQPPGPGGLNGKERPPLPLVQDTKVIEAPADQDKLTERYTDEAVKFITTNKDHPFFLYLPHTAVHVPIHPGQAFKGKSANGRFGDWVEEVDWSVGRVLDTLRDLKLERNTFVIFTSDNGPWQTQGSDAGTAGPLRGAKFSCWEGGMREPTVAWWPGTIPAGAVSDAVMSNIDVLPTLTKLAGGDVPKERIIDGKDIWPVLSGASKESPHEALFYFEGQTLAAVRSGEWKLMIARQKDAKTEKKSDVAAEKEVYKPHLYNLDKDIGETTDVSAQNPEVVNRLQGYLETMDKDLGLKGNAAPGVRPAGHVENPQPLLKRDETEYD